MRGSDLGALVVAAHSLAVRFLREGFVVRALLWPGLLCSLALVVTAGVYVRLGTTPTIWLSDPAWRTDFERDDFVVRIADDPETMLREGDALRAVWREGETIVLGYGLGGRATLRAEAIVRDIADAPWRIDVPPLEARPEDVDRQSGMMAGIIGLLYTLYGVVMGAGSLYRDRSSGFVESELAVARPWWLPAGSRILALSALLAPGLAATLLMIHALLPIDRVGTWILHGATAAAVGGTLGLLLVARAGLERGFSAPLSRALMVAMALLGAGWMRPDLGRWLPVCSLGAFMGEAEPALAAVAIAVLFALGVTAATARMELV